MNPVPPTVLPSSRPISSKSPRNLNVNEVKSASLSDIPPHGKLPSLSNITKSQSLKTANDILQSIASTNEQLDKDTLRLTKDLFTPPKKTKQLDPIHKKQTTSTDMDIVTIMASRLSRVETQLKQLKLENESKTIEIERLKRENEHLHHINSTIDSQETINLLQYKISELQQELIQTKEFFSKHNIVFNPTTSKFIVDPTLLKEQIAQLNQRSGVGVAKLVTFKNKTNCFQIPTPLKLFLYNNGIFFRNNFRLFENESARLFVLDLMDGYFPSEIKQEFPDGHSIEMIDCYDREYTVERVFPGQGSTVDDHIGDHTGDLASNLTDEEIDTLSEISIKSVKIPPPSFINKTWNIQESIPKAVQIKISNENEKTIHSQQEPSRSSKDSFLQKLPQFVIRAGNIINIRSDIQSEFNTKTVEIKDTLKQGVDTKIKLTSKDSVYIVYTGSRQTVKGLIGLLEIGDVEIKCSFQGGAVKFEDSMTMEECGFVPSASVHVKHV